MWYDGDPKRAINEKIERAAEYYRQKRGVRPNTCVINPDTVRENSVVFPGIKIAIAPDVVPDHFWIGIASRAAKETSALRVI